MLLFGLFSYLFFPTALVSDKMSENPKFRVAETLVNEYSLWMNLTIKSLAPGDFGTYICSSVNALGKMESQVSVHSEYDVK